MPKLRREYTLRVLKNAEPKISGQMSMIFKWAQLFTIFYYAFFQIFEYFPIFSYAFSNKLKTICVLNFFKFKSSLKLVLVRELYRGTMKP